MSFTVTTPSGEEFTTDRVLVYFYHGIKLKEFGPYESVDEAREAFQRVYGYWPEFPHKVVPYVGPYQYGSD